MTTPSPQKPPSPPPPSPRRPREVRIEAVGPDRAEDVLAATRAAFEEYRDVLDQMEEKIPDDFPLWDVIENFDREQDFVEEIAEHKRKKSGESATPSTEPEPAAPSSATPEPAAATPEPAAATPEPEAAAPTESEPAKASAEPTPATPEPAQAPETSSPEPAAEKSPE